VWRVREILTTTPTTPITEAVAGGAFGALVGIGWVAFLLWWLAARQDARIRAIHGVTVEQQRRERRAQRARHLQHLPAPVHGVAVAAPRILAVTVSVLVVVANVVWMGTAISSFASGMTVSTWLDVMLTAGAVGDVVVVLAVLATPTWVVAAAWGVWWLRRRRARRGVQVLRWHT
jgi:ABC-type multidrug transport system fused ATPase/permease subunit